MRNKSIVSVATLVGTIESLVLESMEYMQEKGWDVIIMCRTNQHLLD